MVLASCIENKFELIDSEKETSNEQSSVFQRIETVCTAYSFCIEFCYSLTRENTHPQNGRRLKNLTSKCADKPPSTRFPAETDYVFIFRHLESI